MPSIADLGFLSWGSWEAARGSGIEGGNVYGAVGRAPCEATWENIWCLGSYSDGGANDAKLLGSYKGELFSPAKPLPPDDA